MNQLTIQFDIPFVVFLGDVAAEAFAKTGLGLVQWRPHDCVGQVRLPGCTVDAGCADLSVEQAIKAGAKSIIIGSTSIGGGLPQSWLASLRQAAEGGLDIVAGLHFRLDSIDGLADAAKRGNARLIDVRVPPVNLPVGTGRKRTGRRLLTVGTDCASGKKYTALALDKGMRALGMKSEFRATGQTGIMLAGCGIPIDAVVSDFVTGAAEQLSPDNDQDHWDVVEGQGALFHPGYLQVTVGLLVGSQPDAFVVCHDASRTVVSGWPTFALPTIQQVIERTLDLGRLTNPAIRCVGVSLNSSKLQPALRVDILKRYADETGLPCVDPLIDGVQPIIDRLRQEFTC